jgi:hypothetical protein
MLNLNDSLTLNLLTTTIVAPPSNASKWLMGFNSAFKGLMLLCMSIRSSNFPDKQALQVTFSSQNFIKTGTYSR